MIGYASELPWLWAGLAAYAIATFVAIYSVVFQSQKVTSQRDEMIVLGFISAGVLLLVVAMAVRWLHLGHGPFVNLFELIVSQLFSLGLIYALIYWRFPILRASAVVVLPIMWVLGAWVLTLEPRPSNFPPTFDTPWLWVHIGFGKVFLAFCLIATGLAGIILLRNISLLKTHLQRLPSNEILDRYAWRFMILAMAFDSLMLIAGAVWAQDAWGRYWAWDTLETLSFINWLALGLAIHARFTWDLSMNVTATAVVLIFVFAFYTYFGTPFYSIAAHKGVI